MRRLPMAGPTHARLEDSTAPRVQAIGFDSESFSRGTLADPSFMARGSGRARSALLKLPARRSEFSSRDFRAIADERHDAEYKPAWEGFMTRTRTFERLKGLCPPILIVAALALSLGASPASAANNCIQDIFGKKLQCTANDVSLTGATNVRGLDGKPMSTCFAGTKFSFIADFQVVTTATARENIGFYLGTGQTNALSGTCSNAIVSPLHGVGQAGPPGGSAANCLQNGGTSVCFGSALYHEFDTSLAGDNCGDTTSADGTSQLVTFEVDNAVCPITGTTLNLPNCTSWQQPGGAVLCTSDPNQGWPWVPAAHPGTTSKCSCGTIAIPVTPITYSISATKTANPTSLPEPGGDFTYTVGMTNLTTTGGGFGSVIINQLCDNRFGNIATTGACSGGTNAGLSCTSDANCAGGGTCVLPPACPAGTVGTASNVNCSLPQTIAAGATVSNLCSFTGTYTPGTEGTLTDTVTINGFGNTGLASPPAVSTTAQATVTIADGTPIAAVSKSLDGGHECATVRYKVEVDNTSDGLTDEAETLSALTDTAYGDITKTGGNILGTTCGIATASHGSGTLSGAFGAGTLPATIAVGGSYICEFDGQFCGATGPLNGCADNLEQKDTINATLAGDEGEAVTGSTSDSLTVDVCFTATHP
jgi:hypothetical protein